MTKDEFEKQMKALNKKKSELKKKYAEGEQKKIAERNQKVFNAIEPWFRKNHITDEMIMEMDTEAELREMLIGKPQ